MLQHDWKKNKSIYAEIKESLVPRTSQKHHHQSTHLQNIPLL